MSPAFVLADVIHYSFDPIDSSAATKCWHDC